MLHKAAHTCLFVRVVVTMPYAGLFVNLVEEGRAEVAEVSHSEDPLFGHPMGGQEAGGIKTLEYEELHCK